MANRGVSVTIRVNQARLAAYMGSPASPVNAFLLRLGSRVLNNARTRVNVDTGYLRSTGTTNLIPGGGVRVAFRAKYARAVHDGSRAHTIRPRSGKLLKFVVNGQTVYARSVSHPGYKGNPYLTDAMTEELKRL